MARSKPSAGLEAMGRIVELTPWIDADSKAIHVLLVFAHHVNPHGEAWPGVTRLMRHTKLSRRSVQRAGRDLIAAGILIQTGAYRRRRVLRICLDGPIQLRLQDRQAERGHARDDEDGRSPVKAPASAPEPAAAATPPAAAAAGASPGRDPEVRAHVENWPEGVRLTQRVWATRKDGAEIPGAPDHHWRKTPGTRDPDGWQAFKPASDANLASAIEQLRQLKARTQPESPPPRRRCV